MTVKLDVQKRNLDLNPRALRREGLIPVTVYGPDTEPRTLQICQKTFRGLPLSEYTHIIELSEEGADPYDTLMKTVQKNHLSGEVQNIEFYKVKKGHKVTTKVSLHFTGESEAVRLGGELVTVHKEVHIRCIPRKIPAFVEVNLDVLKEIDDSITFGCLKLDDEIELLDPAAEIICKAATKKVAIIEDDTPAEAEAAEGAEGEAAEGAAAEGAEGEAKKDEAKAEDKK